ncbi:MAG: hypothetical protein KGQ66_13700 [Acidobacteriota bacterium]|nr:hypothetical protein [Acidobacteriota bacterium]
MATKKVIVGHGGFDPGDKMILVPNDTTVTFYSDAGTDLGLPFKPIGDYNGEWVEGVNAAFDYDKIKDIIESGYRSQNVVLAGGVVENFSLDPLGAGSAEVARRIDWWGEQAVVPTAGEDLRLCTDPDNCPRPELRVLMQKYLDTGGQEGRLVEEDEFEHKCKGLLATYAGYDIHWVSCTGFTGDMSSLDGAIPDVDTTLSDATDIAWSPDDAAIDLAEAKNQANVKDLDDKASVDLEVGGVLVLIGDGHDEKALQYVRRQKDYEGGTLTVKRSLFGAGSVVIEGVSSGKQSLIEMSIGKFSDKSVKFE